MEYTEKQLNYIKTTIQPFFVTCWCTEFEPTKVTKEKLLKLWFENKKKTIEIIKDDCILPCKQPVVIDKRRTELYLDQKYDKPRTNLSAIFDDYPECNDTEIPDFETEEVGTVLKSLPGRKRWGIDGVRYEVIKIMLSHQKLIYQSVSMSINDSKGHHVRGNMLS